MFTKTISKITSSNKYRCLFALILGSISATVFAPLYFSLAILSFSGWLLIANHCKNFKESFWVGWCFGFGQFFCGLYWISISLFVDISKFFWLLPFALFLIPAILAIYIGLTLSLTNYVAKKLEINDWQKILLLSVTWVFFEYLRSTLFTGFPWNLLGYSFLFSLPLSQFASIVGIYGLSLIAIIFYCSPSLFIKFCHNKIKFGLAKKNQPFLAIVSVIIAIIWIGGFFRLNNFHATLIPNSTFRLVQPAIDQKEKWGADSRYNSFLENINLSRQDGFEKINYVVWSESAVPYIIDPKTSYGFLNNIASVSSEGGFIITGAMRAEFKNIENGDRKLDKIWNTIFAINHKAEIVDYYDKNHLVPFGEYIPFSDSFSFISKITDGGVNFSSGKARKTIKLSRNSPSFSPLVCYEAIFSNNIINKNNPPKFLLNLTNDAWFGSSSGPYQHFDMVRMRSIEYGLPIIRVANSGISALISPVGKIVDSIPLNKKGIIDVELMNNLPATIFMRMGNHIVLIISALLLIITLFKNKKS
jgi:apolipoprotein N-acyltransferase